MTAEEYLNEHCKPEDWNNLEESLKDSIWTNNVIEYMEQYAALRIHDVSIAKRTVYCECSQRSLMKPISPTEYECFDCGKEVKQ